jgi:hypothetical protein
LADGLYPTGYFKFDAAKSSANLEYHQSRAGERRAELITCFIRYTLDSEKLHDFEQYAQVWMRFD